MTKEKLDREEQEILDSYERGEWNSVAELKEQIEVYQASARATTRKDARVNIRISSKDLESLQKLALAEGIPYQTLIASVLHKYVSGRLVERGP